MRIKNLLISLIILSIIGLTNLFADIPTDPAPITPQDSLLTNYTELTFVWNESTSAAHSPVSYVLEVSTEVGFAPIYDSSDTILTTATISGLTLEETYYYRIRARDSNLDESTSTVRSFVIDISSPGAFAITSPIDDFLTNEATLTFDWSASVDANFSNYILEISSDIDFSWIDDSSNTTNTQADITVPSEDVYYARVSAFDAVGYETLTSTQVLELDTTAPGAFNITSPVDDFLTNEATLTFDWSASVDANFSNYILEISSDINFSWVDDSSVTTNTQADITVPSEDVYYARVSAFDAVGYETLTSTQVLELDTTAPGAFAITSPIDDLLTNEVTLTFDWSASVDANFSNYILEISSDIDFSWIDDSSNTTNTQADITVPSEDVYYARVSAFDAVGYETLTSTQVLELDTTAPGAFNITSPVDDFLTNQASLTFDWSASVDANFSNYILEISSDINFSWIDDSSNTTNTQADITVPSEDVYYARVAAFDAVGYETLTSTQVLELDTTAPGAFAITSPIDDFLTNEATLTFDWSASVDANFSNYILEISSDINFSWIDDSSNTTNTQADITVPSEDVYYARVAAFDAVGYVTLTSTQVLELDTTAPGAFAITSPIDDFLTNEATLTFDWSASVDANFSNYILEISSDINFSWIDDSSNTTNTQADITVPSEDVYYARVAAFDAVGYETLTSTQVLELDTTAPGAFEITSPIDDLLTNEALLTFEWGASVDANLLGYTLEISSDINFSWVDDSSVTTNTQAEITVPSEDVYYARVAALDAVGYITLTSTQVLELDTTAPGAFEITSPIDDLLTNEATLTFEWGASVDANLLGYTLEISSDINFSWVDDSSVTTNTQAEITVPSEDVYYARVAALDAVGYITLTSTQVLELDTTAPGAFAITSPIDDLLTNEATLTFEWGASVDANLLGYTLEISSDINFSWVDDSSNTTNTQAEITVPSEDVYYARVAALDAVGYITLTSTQVLELDTTAPGAFAITSPIDDLLTNEATLTFDWGASVDANFSNYILEISSDINFSWIDDSSNTTNTQADITVPSDDVYYARVAAFDAVGYETLTSTQVLELDTTAPGVFAITSPIDDFLTNEATLTFEWGASVDANLLGYTLEISSDINFSWVDDSSVTTNTQADITVPSDDVYYARVKAEDEVGYETLTSTQVLELDTTAPGAFEITSPIDDFLTNEATLTFEWGASVDANLLGYTLEISSDINFSWVDDSSVTTNTQAEITVPSDDVYYARVKAEDEVGYETLTSTQVLELDTISPTVAVLTSDTDSLNTTYTTLTFHWNPAIDNNLAGYKLEVSVDPGFGAINYSSNTVLTSATITGITDETYYARVKSYDLVGHESESLYHTFLVDKTSPTPANLTSPADNLVTDYTTLTFSWSGGQDDGVGLSHYLLEISEDPGFGVIYYSSNTVLTSADITGLVEAIYYTRVRTYDNLNYYDFSTAQVLTVDKSSPTAFNITAPIDNLLTNNANVVFNWNPTYDLSLQNYTLEISTDINFDPSVTESSITIISTAVVTLAQTDVYYARVKALDEIGYYTYTDTQTFTLDIDEPTQPLITSPVDELLTTETELTFTWSESTEIGLAEFANYELEVSTEMSFDTIAYSSITVITTATITGLVEDTYYTRVKAFDTVSNSTSSNVQWFILDRTSPTVSSITAPEDDLLTNYTMLSFTWGVPTEPNLVGYELQLSTDIDFGVINYSSNTIVNNANIDNLTEGIYYARVLSYDVMGYYSIGSTNVFTADIDAPNGPALVSPINNYLTDYDTLSFNWLAREDLTKVLDYRLEIDNNEDFGSLDYSSNTVLTQATITGISKDIYYWRVRARTALNGYGDAQETRVFRTQDLAPPAKITYLAVTVEGNAKLTFNAPGDDGNTGNISNGALEIRYTDNETHEVLDALSILKEPKDYLQGDEYSETLSGLNINTIYFFWVRVRDDNNNWGEWSNRGLAQTDIFDDLVDLPGLFSGAAIAWGDYDNDGDLDIAISGSDEGWSYYTYIYKNNGDGTFTDIEASLESNYRCALAWGDYNNDGYLDLFWSSEEEYDTYVYENQKDGTFEDASIDFDSEGYASISLGDYNNDGYIDMLGSGEGDGIALFKNNQDGTFTDINDNGDKFIDTNERTVVSFADFNNDGKLDILSAGPNDDTKVGDTALYINNGNDTFTNINPNYNYMIKGYKQPTIEVGDYDNDGDIDFAISGKIHTGSYLTEVYRNNGDNTFTVVFNTFGMKYGALSFADYDNDGDLDLTMMGRTFVDNPDDSTGESKFRLFNNNGSDTFVDSNVRIDSLFRGSIAWGDYNGDGVLDLAVNGSYGDHPEYGWEAKTRIYRSGLVTSNNAPSAPTNLSATFNETTRIAEFSWDKASDTETSQDGLYYEVSAATSDVTGDVSQWLISPLQGAGVGKNRAQMITPYGQKNSQLLDTGILEDILVYYQVRAVDPSLNKSAWSSVASVYIPGTPPTQAVLTSGFDNLLTNNTTLTFNWNPSTDTLSGLKEYRLEISNDINFGSLNYSSTTVITTASVTGFTDGIYYTRVKAIDNALLYSYSSTETFTIDVTSPTVPALVSPVDEFLTTNASIEFTWTESSDIHFKDYTLELSTDVDFGVINYSSITILLTANIGVIDNTYYYRLRADDTLSNYSAWTDTQVFTMNGEIPTTAEIISPVDALVTSYMTQKFVWNASTDTSGIANYELEISDDILFNTVDYSSTTQLTTATISGLAENNYYYRLRARDFTEVYGLWTETREFTVDNTSPTVVSILTPVDNSEIKNEDITFSWSAPEDLSLDLYLVLFSTTPDVLSNTMDGGPFGSNSITLPASNFSDDKWYFLVQAYDKLGYYSTSSTRAFTVDTTNPSIVTITKPTSGDKKTGNAVEFIWTEATDGQSGLANYELQVSVDSNFATIDYSSVTISTQAVITGLTADTYYYRVRAIDNFENFSLSSQGNIELFLGLVFEGMYNGSVAIWGDYDGDGDLDIAASGYSVDYIARIYRNDGNNVFTDIEAGLIGENGLTMAWADFDNDGDLDLIISPDGGGLKIYRNDGDDIFTDSDADSKEIGNGFDGPMTLGDFNNDGYIDIAFFDDPILFKNNGNFVFERVDDPPFYYYDNDASGVFGDYNNDGYLDVFSAGNGNPPTIAKNNGDGTFTRMPVSDSLPENDYSATEFGDFDNDGDLDIALTGNSDALRIYRNDGNDSFSLHFKEYNMGGDNWTLSFIDFDNDGDLDLTAAGVLDNNPYTHYVKIYGNDAGTFTDLGISGLYLDGIEDGSIAWGDYDNDGDLDLLVTGEDSNGDAMMKIVEFDESNTNTLPTSPTNLSATYDTDLGEYILTWDKATDAETPEAGLYYEVKIATEHVNGDLSHWLVSPLKGKGVGENRQASITKFPHGYIGGEETLQPGFRLKIPQIEGKTVYFKARTVDTALGKSAWSSQEGSIYIPAVPPTVAVINEPANNLITSDTTLTFNWNPSTDAHSGLEDYTLEISSDVSFSWIDYSSQTILTTATIAGITDETYYARVKAKDFSGIYSLSSVNMFTIDLTSPTVPVLVSPIDEFTTTNSNIEFSWTTSTDEDAGVSHYDLVLSTDVEFGIINYSSSTILLTSNINVIDETYYVKIRAIDNLNNYGVWSDTIVFTMNGGVPQIPEILLPVAGFVTDYATQKFVWNVSSDESGIALYELEISSDILFNTVDYSSTTVLSTATISGITESNYYYRLRAKDFTDVYGLWTDVRSFAVDMTSPTVVNIISPEDSLETTNDYITVSWSTTSDLSLDTYKLEVSTDQNFGIIDYSSNTTLSSADINSISDDIYYYKITALDKIGYYTETSTRSFTVDTTSPSVVTITKPINSITTLETTLEFVWTESNDVTSGLANYELQVSTDSSFGIINYSSVTVSTQAVIADLPINQYYYRIKSVDNFGNYSLSSVNAIVVINFKEITGLVFPGLDNNSEVVFADYNNDGYLDVALAGYNGSQYITKVYRNKGDNTFEDSGNTFYTGSNGSFAWGDYNNDGYLDLFLVSSDYSKIYTNKKDGTFDSGVTLTPNGFQSIFLGDYNNDGYIDVFLSGNWNGAELLRNNGDNTFTNINVGNSIFFEPESFTASAFADFDNDGDLDVIFAGEHNPTELHYTGLYINNGDETFTNINPGFNDMIKGYDQPAIAVGDYDSDGDLDFAISGRNRFDNYVTEVYRNNGNNNFTAEFILYDDTRYRTLLFADYDNDGDLDFMITGSYSQASKIYRNDSGLFVDSGVLVDQVSSGSAAWGDFDNDSDLDLLITGNSVLGRITKLYESNFSETNPNTKPDKLNSNLALDFNTESNMFTFTWDKGTDAQTPSAGLYYDIRVATNPINDFLDKWVVSTSSGAGLGHNKQQAIGNYSHGYINESLQAGFELNGPSTIENTTYYFQVRAIDTGRMLGDFSDSVTYYFPGEPPTVATINEPVSNLLTNAASLTFNWNPSVDALSGLEYYTLEISSDVSFSWIDYSSTTILTTATISGITDEVYYARVKATDFSGLYSLSSSRIFEVDTTSPTAPVLTTPIDALTTDQIELTFNWSPSNDENLAIYELEISEDIGFATIDYSSSVAITTATVSVWVDETYYYRVRSYDSVHNYSDWSSTQVLTMNGGVPSTPEILLPVSDLVTDYATQTFVWNASTDTSGIKDYTLEISTYVDFGYINSSSNTILTTSTITGFTSEDIYYYRLRARDFTDQYSFNTETRVFTIDDTSPTVVSILSPIDNFLTNETNIEIDFTDTVDLSFDTYLLQYSTNIGFSTPVTEVYTTQSSTRITSLEEGLYYLRIVATDKRGYYTLSDTQTFTVDTTSPSIVSVISHANGLLTTQASQTFIWTDSQDFSGIDYYELQISTDSGFGIYVSSTTTLTEAEVMLSNKGKYYYRVVSRDNLGLKSYSSVYDITRTNFIEDTTITNLPNVKDGDITFGDYDNDGDLDIALSGKEGTSERLKIYRNNGDNTYTEIYSGYPFIGPIGANESSLSFGDFDNDSDLDLLVSGDLGIGLKTFIIQNKGNDTFGDEIDITGADLRNGSVVFADYNNDGDIDLAVSGIDDSNDRYTLLYTNNGDKTYSKNTLVNFVGVEDSSLDFGDIDNDGDLDLLVSGFDGTSGITKLYRNNGDETFTDTMQSLENVRDSASSFGDIDNDGDIDLILAGRTNSSYITKIYTNNSGIFSESGQSIIGTGKGNIELGDIDNDGDLDLVITGETDTGDATLVYHNASGTFTLDETIQGLHNGTLTLADYDGDSDLDIILAGDTVFGSITKIFESIEDTANTKPNAPTSGFSLAYSEEDADITYTWNQALDAQTQSNSLYYEVRVATVNLTDDLTQSLIVSPSTGAGTGLGKGQMISQYNRGYLGSAPGFKLKLELENTTYYFQVRTIDTGLAKSVWSTEQFLYVSNVKPQVVNIIEPEVNDAIEGNSINFHWENAGLDTIVDYELDISSYSDFSYIWYSTITVSTNVIVSTTSIELGNHYYRIRARDDYGLYGDYNPERYVTRKNVLPPENFAGSAVSETSIVWSWVDQSSVETGYGIRSQAGGIITGDISSNKTLYLEEDLLPNTQYTRYAEVYDSVTGSTETSVSKSVYTLANTPSGLVSNETKKHTVELSFNGLGGTAYKIERSSDLVNWVVIEDKIQETQNIKTNHLKPDTEYWYSVRAYNGDYVLTQGSTTLKIRTLEVPEARLDPTVENKVEKEIILGDITLKPKVTIPANSVTETVYVRITNPLEEVAEVDKDKILDADDKLEEGKTKVDITLEFNMYNLIGDRFTGNFNNKVTLEFPYSDVDQDGYIDGTEILEESVEIYVLNETTDEWELVGGVVDADRNVVTAELEHFSVYTLISSKQAASDLANAIVYPNPYKVGSGTKFDRSGGVLFDKLTKNAKIRVYNIMGRLVYEGIEADGDGKFEWNATNEHGKKVSSGVYIYIITNEDDKSDKAKGKLGIIR